MSKIGVLTPSRLWTSPAFPDFSKDLPHMIRCSFLSRTSALLPQEAYSRAHREFSLSYRDELSTEQIHLVNAGPHEKIREHVLVRSTWGYNSQKA